MRCKSKSRNRRPKAIRRHFHPRQQWCRADPAVLAHQIDNAPAPVALLDMREREGSHLGTPESAPKKDDAIARPTNGRNVGSAQVCLRPALRRPVSRAVPLSLGALHSADALSQFPAREARCLAASAISLRIADLLIMMDDEPRRWSSSDPAARSIFKKLRVTNGVKWNMAPRDVYVAWRTLTRQPTFLFFSVLTLALGIGANTAVFSVVKSVVLEPLPYREPDRIVAVQTFWTNVNRAGNISGGDYADLVAEPSPFAAATRYSGGELPLFAGGQAEFAGAFGVDDGFLDVFRITPMDGRLITAEEFRRKDPVALVSETFAVRHFGSAPRAIGQTIRLEENALSIVGVIDASFHFPVNAHIWFPQVWESTSRTVGNYKAVALLKPGVTLDAAQARLSMIGSRLEKAFPVTHRSKTFTVMPLKDLFIERTRTTLWVLMASVGFVLLIACANVANLTLARSQGRLREMAIRAAMGASRTRLLCQAFVECSLVGLLGGAIALILAKVSLIGLVRLAPANLPRLGEIHIDKGVLVFNLVVSLGAAGMFGIWPAIQAARADLIDVMRRGGRSILGGGGREWTRGALVSGEIALALVLSIGAALLFRSFLALQNVDLGYQTEHRIVLTASIPAKTETEHVRAGATFERIFADLRALPGVRHVAGVMGLPNGPYGSDGLYAVEGRNDFECVKRIGETCAEVSIRSGSFDSPPHAGFRLTSPGYFTVMGVPILEGRDFDERDGYEAEPVVIVSAALAREVFDGADPVGRRIKCGFERVVWMRIVGVVGDMRNENPAIAPGPELYMPYRQQPYHANDLHIVVRAESDVSATAFKAIAQVDPSISVKLGTLEQFRSEAVALPRFRTLLLIIFAGVAGVLAIGGVYGLMSYLAAQRTSEMGVRIALGATRLDVISLIVGQGAKLTAIGVSLGLAGALLATRWIESMLFGVRATNAVALGVGIGLLSVTALLAALVPAIGVSRVDPAVSLRRE